ncbi:MAG: adenylyl-sulfate kinase [Candidatus Nealsonbacteria bacterium]
MTIDSAKYNQGFTLWFTGLPSSGKSTLANAVAEALKKRGIPVEKIDGDLFRQTISKDLGFTPEDIQKNDARAVFVSQLLTRNGIATLTSFVSPYRKDREKAREKIGNFIEVYVKCPLEECIKRDPKGNYKKALDGEIPNFIGLSSPYEEPENPDIVVETDKESIIQCTQKIISALKTFGYLN